jgi:hypothetical protein
VTLRRVASAALLAYILPSDSTTPGTLVTALPPTPHLNPPATVPPKCAWPKGSLNRVKNPKLVVLGPCRRLVQLAGYSGVARKGNRQLMSHGMVRYILFVQLITANFCLRLCQELVYNLLNQHSSLEGSMEFSSVSVNILLFLACLY